MVAIIWITTLLTILSLKLITMLVYYRLDVELRKITILTNTKDETDNKDVEGSEVIGSPNKSPLNTLPGSFEMKDWSIENSKTESNETRYIPKQSYKQDSTGITTFQSNKLKGTSSTAQIADNIQSADETPYGGIYVGETSITDVLCTNEVTSREDEVHRSKIDDAKPQNDAEVAKAYSVFSSYHDSSLPNMVLRESKDGLDSSAIHGVCLKRHDQQEDTKTQGNNPRNKDKVNDDDRIVVVQEWFEEESREPMENNKNIEDGPKDKSEFKANAYEDSKEHKSIKKALLVNFFFLAFCCAVKILTIIIYAKSEKGNAIFLLKTLFSLYKTLLPIISSIYCFDVIHCLYRQLLETTTNNLHNAYDIVRGML